MMSLWTRWIVWFADDATPERTLGKLDPHTGRVTDYKLADSANAAESSHALVFDRQGNIWFANGTEGSPTKFDPETGKFVSFPRPEGIPYSGDFITLDRKGMFGLRIAKELSNWIPSPEIYELFRCSRQSKL